MPVVAFFQRGTTLYRPNGYLNVGLILVLTLACALIDAVIDDLALRSALAASPGAWPDLDAHAYFFAYLLGAYVGALTLAPSILALREMARARSRPAWRSTWQDPLARGLIVATVTTMFGAALLAPTLDGWKLQACRLGTLLPVIVLTLRHGWQGCALSGLLASIVMASTSTTLLDPPMIHAQVVLALTLSGSLMAGTRIAQRRQRHAGQRVERPALD
jgi:glucose-6-phosphate-specific signal transduction histidine kinase